MRGDGPDGRQGSPLHADTSELDTLPTPGDHGAGPGYDAGWDDEAEWDDDTPNGEAPDVGGTTWAAPAPGTAPDPLDEADALYDDGDDEYDDDGGWGDPVDARHRAATAWPAPSHTAADADGPYDDDEAYDDGDAAPTGAYAGAAVGAYGGYDDEPGYDESGYDEPAYDETGYDETGYGEAAYDETDDGAYAGVAYGSEPYDEDDAYGEADSGYDPAWLTPVGAAATAPGGTGEPAIWAPGTAPGAWVPLGRPRFGNPLPDPGRLTVRTRRRNLSVFSLAGITNVVLFGYAVTALLLAAFTAALGRRLAALQGVEEAEARADALARSEYLVDVTATGVLALLAATLVASMVWTGVAARNQRLLGEDRTLMSPLLAVVGWLIPVVNLYVPLRAVSEAAAGPRRSERVPGAALRWWVSWVVAAAACVYALRAALTTADDAVPGTIKSLTIVSAVATVVFLYCFSQASTLLRQIARLQHHLAVERD